MYDIYLADVSDRNNYIGSIFNAVIYVPSIDNEKNKDLIDLFIENKDIIMLKDIFHNSHIDEYLKEFLGEEWEEQLSGYYENQQALSHYYKCLEMHREGKAYHNMIDSMCYLKDDYNDRSDHFNIAEERHNILNENTDKIIEELKKNYENSKLYEVNNYFDGDK